ncbi:ricin-type beta-trefoil lectin domain protein, partial [Streptomyces broussonetiae]|uniref:ricin-type beta-trefoil lectin domain protein n=1 Tax=Streptomyces broussonetiae TaxID=2686304 RepID=UPI0035DE1B7C
MKPPHTPRSAGDLPKRVPGSAKRVGSGSPPARNGEAADDAEPTAPKSDERAPDKAESGASPPRFTRFSSLGSRANTGRGPAAPSSTADTPVDGSVGDRFDESFARHGEARTTPAADIVVPLEPAGPPPKGKVRRAGSRGALGVVGVVGLLAVVGVLLALGLTGGHEGGRRDASSVAVGSDGHGSDVVDGLGGPAAPSASAGGTAPGKKPAGSGKSPSGSATTGAPGKASASAGGHAAPSAKAAAKDGTNAPAVAAPGVNVSSHASQRCIDIVGGKAVPGAGLMIWDCSQSASQHWTFSDGTMRALGMCVQLAGGSTDDGTDLEMASCDGSPAQRFDLNYRHDLVSGPANKCADVRDDQTANGTRIQLWSCSGNDNQK